MRNDFKVAPKVPAGSKSAANVKKMVRKASAGTTCGKKAMKKK
jgi:hypothetical protein